jgi:hypothetical protein
MTDYLDKQAVREKQKRKEKFLTVLPTYLEQQLAGVKDEKSLFSTIPKLSAQMYAFGPEVGQAANQILGQLADVKYKEIAQVKQEKETGDTLNVLEGITKNIPGVGTAVSEHLGRTDISDDVKAKTMQAVINANTMSTTGLGVQKSGKYFYQTYTKKGDNPYEPSTQFELKPTKSGYGMDVVGTPEVEELPLTMEAMKYMEEEMSYKQKAEDQLRKSLSLQAGAYDIAQKKADEQYAKGIRKGLYFDRTTKEPVFADVDENGTPYFYKKEKQQITTSVGKTPFFEEKKTILKDLSNVEQVGQSVSVDEMTSTDIRLETSKANLYAQNIGQAMIAAGDVADADIRDPNTGYFKIDELIKTAEKYPEKYGDVKSKIIELNLSGASTLTGQNKPTTSKPKW